MTFGRVNKINNHITSTIKFIINGSLISIAVRNGSKTITKAQIKETFHLIFAMIFQKYFHFPCDSKIS